MSVARKCDRCGSLYEIYDGIGFSDANLSKWNGMQLNTNLANSRNKSYDLCPNCMKALLSFINDSKKKEIPIICKDCMTCMHGQCEGCEECSNWEGYHD